MTYAFAEVDVPDDLIADTTPPLEDVEYPCEVCGQEAGPYGGRGRKPKRCQIHKKSTSNTAGQSRKITGSAATLAAQATQVLVQMNGFIAMGAMVTGLHRTAGSIAEANNQFEAQVHAALLTDTELCKTILKSGSLSAKTSLGIAYMGFAMSVAPVAWMEYRENKAAREVGLEDNG